MTDRPPSTFVLRRNDQVRKANALKALDKWLESSDVEVTFAVYHPKRSDAQHHTFYWWCDWAAKQLRDAGVPCAETTVHDEVMASVYGWEDMGFGHRRPKRTLTRPHRMSKMDMIEVLNRFEKEWAPEQGLVLPQPEKFR